MKNKNKNLIDCALKYQELGFSIIPVKQDKRPLIKWEEFQNRKATKEEIKDWFNKSKAVGVGVVTGAISGIVVVDVEAGGETKDLPPTVMSKTGGGGWHFFYKHPGRLVKNAVRIRDKMDIRGDGGFVVVPPSLHASGKRYEWLVAPEYAGFEELPQWILESGEGKEVSKTDWQQFMASKNSEGVRNMSASQLAGKLLYHLPTELWEVAGWVTLKEWNNNQNQPSLAEKELRSVWESIKEAEAERRVKNQDIKFDLKKEKRTPISFEELEKIVSKWLLIKDEGLLRILLASVIANKLQADPVWLFLVAAPGGTKTELIRGLNKIDGIYPISDLTPQTLLSGERGKDASLLLRLPFGTIFTYKDFTTVLSMHRDKQQAIISQLREIFDGYYRKEFGTGETKTWEGKIGFIAGVTSVIDRHYEIYSVLGERFIQYRPVQSDSIALAKKAMANSGGEKRMREEIQNAIADYIAGIKIPEERMAVSEELQDHVAHLAAFCVKARSGILRDGYSTREIDLIPDTELPTRLAKQLITLLSALLLIGHTTSEVDYELIRKVAMDSLPQKRRLALNILMLEEEQLDTADIALKIGYPTNTTRRILEDLHGLGLVDREHEGKGYADKWQISKYAKMLWNKAMPSYLKPENSIKSDIQEDVSDKSGNLNQEITNLFDNSESNTLPEMSVE